MADPIEPVVPTADLEDTSPTQRDVFERPTAPKRNADKIPRQFGRYKIMDCLGRGGMGAVFRAQDTQLDREVALKVPFLGDDEEDTRQRFYREARAAATLHQANICPVFDVGEFQGIPYLTMAFIDGKSLHTAITQKQNFTFQHIALLLRKLTLAMQEAHNRGVVHRDLKPSNVIIRPNNEPIIMDFGLARRADDQKSAGLTQQGDIIGTIDYMSPEQVEGKNDTVGPAADIYALGVILYEMLTGRLPYEGSTTGKLAAILVKDPPKPSELRPDVPAKLEEICLKAMAKKTTDRIASMAQFANLLVDFLRSPASPPKPEVTPAPKPAVAPAPKPAPSPSPAPPVPAPETAATKSAPTEVKRSEPSGAKSATRSSRRRGSSRRKAKSGSSNSWIWIVAGLFGLLVVGGVIAGIVYAVSNGSNSSHAEATKPKQPPVPSPPPLPPSPNNKKNPDNADPPEPKKPTPPKTAPALVVRPQPAGLELTTGMPQKCKVKVERGDYQGPIRLSWKAPANVRVTPAGPVTLQPGQADPEITLLLMSEAAPPMQRMEFTATAVDDPNRKSQDLGLEVRAGRGDCIRIVELGGLSNFSIDAIAFNPNATMALGGGGAGPQGGGPGSAPGAEAPSEHNAIHVWNLEKAESVTKLVMHRDRVKRLLISADGKTGMSISADGTVGLWDMIQGQKKLQSPRLGEFRLLNAAISEDGKRGLVVYNGLALKIDLATFKRFGTEIVTAPYMASKLDDAVRTVAVSTDRKALIGGIDGKLFLFDWTEKTKPKALKGHDEAVLCSLFSPSGQVAATGGGGVLQVGALQPGKDNAVRMWDIAGATMKWKAEGHARPVVALAFSSDGKLLASGSADGEIRIWQVEDGKPVATFSGHGNRVLGLTFTPDGKQLWSGAADRTVRHWRLP
jgi:serine/threonine protein kinase